MQLKNEKSKSFVETLKTRDWKKTREISGSILVDELEASIDKSILRIGLGVMYYYLQGEQNLDNVIDSYFHEDIDSNLDIDDLEEYFPELCYQNIYIESLLAKTNRLEKEVKDTFGTEKCKKYREEYNDGSAVWLDYNKILEALRNGENIIQ